MFQQLKVIGVVLLLASTSLKAKESGLLTFKSEYSTTETLTRLKASLAKKQFKVFSHIDHSAGAKSNNISLRDTQLVIFGNPKVGSKLMQCNQTIAIDLPQKALIWIDADGSTWLAFNNPNYLFQRHQLKECQQIITKITKVLTRIAKDVTQKGSEQ